MNVAMSATTRSPSKNDSSSCDEISEAINRVKEEQSSHTQKRDAYRKFKSKIESLESEPQDFESDRGALRPLQSTNNTTPQAKVIIQAFARDVGECLDRDLSQTDELKDALQEELSEGVTEALCSSMSAKSFPAQLKNGLLSIVGKRVNQENAVVAALDHERESLRSVEEELARVTNVIRHHNQRHLLELGFRELRDLRQELLQLQSSLDDVAHNRQADIFTQSGTTNTKVDHHSVVEMCYRPFESMYPALANIARVTTMTVAARETVESHLFRRH